MANILVTTMNKYGEMGQPWEVSVKVSYETIWARGFIKRESTYYCITATRKWKQVMILVIHSWNRIENSLMSLISFTVKT